MIVCLCNNYREKDIRAVVQAGGVESADDAYQALGNGFCCGCCRDCAAEIVAEELPKRVLVAAE